MIEILNASPLFSGAAMMIMSLGSRFVMGDVGKQHELIFNNGYIKQVIIFFMFFIGCRDIYVALCLTLAYHVIMFGIFNELYEYNLIPSSIMVNEIVPYKDYVDAQKIVKSYERKEAFDPVENPIYRYKTFLFNRKNNKMSV